MSESIKVIISETCGAILDCDPDDAPPEVVSLARFRQLERQLEAAPVEGTWQPIASAPKDGTPVLAWMIDDAPHRAWQSKDERNAPGICYWTQHNGGGWVSHRFGTPTHWMPLPSPPKENAE